MFKNIVGDHKPDILDCLSNLSSDEVFTPPTVAEQILDLLPSELWTDPEIRILDPACKSGVFLREAAKRLMIGLEATIPDEDERRLHIFEKMLFGISITALTGLMSRRSLYYSKNAASKHAVVKLSQPDGNIHYSRGTHVYGRNGRCQFCGAPKGDLDRGEHLENYAYQFIHKKDIFDMKFDVIVGNPPYQLEDEGYGASASPIYQLFVNQAIQLNPSYLAMIIPARWYAGGKGLDEFRNQMINDRRMKYLVDYPKLFECFPGVEIKGGVCYFLWESKYDGDCTVRTIFDGKIVSEATRDLRDGGDVLVRSNEGVLLLKKVQARLEKTLEEIVSSRKPFGLPTNVTVSDTSTQSDDLVIFRRGGVSYIRQNEVAINKQWIDKFKVLTPMAGDGHGRVPAIVTGEPIVAPPHSVCSETYLVVNVYDGPDAEAKANNLATYLKTKFVRFLISLRKNTQHVTKERFSFVPDLDMSRTWTDADLYARYGLTDEEIAFVESNIKEMP